MAITKQFLKSKPLCKVTFIVPAEEAKEVKVVGSFNNWDSQKNVLKKLKNGTFKGTLDLETGNSYEFKYIIDGVYVNDTEADSYLWNDYAATENCVISLV
jgi:1,4-alpha-glucan branching enzyme